MCSSDLAGPGARAACDEDDDDGCLMLDDEEWSDTELYVLQHAGKMVESAPAVLHGAPCTLIQKKSLYIIKINNFRGELTNILAEDGQERTRCAARYIVLSHGLMHRSISQWQRVLFYVLHMSIH